jgi:hypothetical protein
MPYSSPKHLCFPPVGGQTLLADCEGGALSSDFGALLLRGIDRQIGLTARLAAAMQDKRHPSSIDHPLRDLLAQRIYQIAARYADGNDANSLRHDPMFRSYFKTRMAANFPMKTTALDHVYPLILLLQHKVGTRLFDILLRWCAERGWLKAGSTQRTDATHVLTVAHNLTLLELVLLTLTHALDTLAHVAPEWVVAQCPAAWGERDGVLLNEWHLSSKEDAWQALAQQAGVDGHALLRTLWATPALYEWLRQGPAVEALRRILVQQFC